MGWRRRLSQGGWADGWVGGGPEGSGGALGELLPCCHAWGCHAWEAVVRTRLPGPSCRLALQPPTHYLPSTSASLPAPTANHARQVIKVRVCERRRFDRAAAGSQAVRGRNSLAGWVHWFCIMLPLLPTMPTHQPTHTHPPIRPSTETLLSEPLCQRVCLQQGRAGGPSIGMADAGGWSRQACCRCSAGGCSPGT